VRESSPLLAPSSPSFFAYFLLAKQKKVMPRRQGASGSANKQLQNAEAHPDHAP
jgi:hypothetical protein